MHLVQGVNKDFERQDTMKKDSSLLQTFTSTFIWPYPFRTVAPLPKNNYFSNCIYLLYIESL